MCQKLKNVLLIGASGNLGTTILSTLIASQKFKISVLTRPSSTAVFPPTVKVFKSTYDNISTLTPAFTHQDAIICTLNHHTWSSQFLFIDLALVAGVQRFIPSEFGTNTLNEKVAKLWGSTGGVKKELIDYLRKTEGKGMSWTGVATGTFFEWGLQNSLYGFSLPHRTATLYTSPSPPPSEKPFTHTTIPQIARALLAVLLRPATTSNKYLYIQSFSASQSQILAALQQSTAERSETQAQSPKPWTVTNASLAEAEREGKEKLAKGDFSGAALLLHVNFMGEGYGSDFQREELGNELLGLEGEDLGGVVRGVVEGRV